MQRESADRSVPMPPKAPQTPTSRGRTFAVRWLCCLLVVANLAGCCYVPGGSCRTGGRNGFKVGPNYCARRRRLPSIGSTMPTRA